MARSQVSQPQVRAGRRLGGRWAAQPAEPSKQAGARPLGAEACDRRGAISRVVALWPHELTDDSPPARRKVLAKLKHALREERRRGLAGHWSYDLARHVELLRVYREVLAALSPNAPAAPRR